MKKPKPSVQKYREARKQSCCEKCQHFLEFVVEKEAEPRAVCLFGKRITEFPKTCQKFDKVKDTNIYRALV